MTDTLERLVADWARAELGGDVEALRDLLLDDFVGIGPMGFMLDKEQWLARYTSGGFEYKALKWDELQVRDYGSCAVVTGVQDQDGRYQGNPVIGRFRGSQVYVQADGRWRLAGVQLSLMPGTVLPGAPGAPGAPRPGEAS